MITLQKSNRKDKKWMVVIPSNHKQKTIHFGAIGYEDYTMHKDKNRKKQYIQRHQTNEDWTKQGIWTPGFWSRWLLWNKTSIQKSVRDINKQFKLNVLYK